MPLLLGTNRSLLYSQPAVVTASTFSPLSLSPALWLKADAGLYQERSSPSTPANDDGEVVGTWQDQSGNGRHLAAGSDNGRPVLKVNQQNGLSVVRHDGVDDYLYRATGFATGDTAHTLLLIARKNAAPGGYNGFCYFNGGSSSYANSAIGAVGSTAWWGGFGITTPTGGDVGSGFHLLCKVYDTSPTITGYLDGTQVYSAGQGAPYNLSTGDFATGCHYGPGAGLLACDIGELLLFERLLTGDELAAVNGYLNGRWGVY